MTVVAVQREVLMKTIWEPSCMWGAAFYGKVSLEVSSFRVVLEVLITLVGACPHEKCPIINEGLDEGLDERVANLSKEVWALDVETYVVVEVLLGSVLEIFHGHHPRVRDQDVDLAKTLHGLGDHALDVGDAACVGFDGEGTVFANMLDELFSGGGI